VFGFAGWPARGSRRNRRASGDVAAVKAGVIHRDVRKPPARINTLTVQAFLAI
jgi:hypothetical protein